MNEESITKPVDSPLLEGSRFQQADRPREKIELLMDLVWDMLGEAEVYEMRRMKYGLWNELLAHYHNLVNRTNHLVGFKEPQVHPKNYGRESLERMKKYLSSCQGRGLYKVGEQEHTLRFKLL